MAGKPKRLQSAALPPGYASVYRKLAPLARPVFPYPRIARYDGTGSIYKAKNYSAAQPAKKVHIPHWMGSDFYRPDFQQKQFKAVDGHLVGE